jgi:hypothetical protein
MKKWWYAAGALLLAIGLGILGGPGRKEKKLVKQRDDLILEGSGRAKAEAHQKGIQADKHQANAVKAAEAGKKAMDRAGKNESTADLLDSWRKPVDGV